MNQTAPAPTRCSQQTQRQRRCGRSPCRLTAQLQGPPLAIRKVAPFARHTPSSARIGRSHLVGHGRPPFNQPQQCQPERKRRRVNHPSWWGMPASSNHPNRLGFPTIRPPRSSPSWMVALGTDWSDHPYPGRRKQVPGPPSMRGVYGKLRRRGVKRGGFALRPETAGALLR